MRCQWMVGAAVAAVLVVPGCSSDVKPTVPAPTSKTAASAAATESPKSSPSSEDDGETDEAIAPLDGEACVEITGASLDLSAAMNGDDARTAADTLEKYDPPGSAKTAIEHFVETGGAQFDDPDFSTFNGDLDGWVHQVCPL